MEYVTQVWEHVKANWKPYVALAVLGIAIAILFN